MKTHFSSKKISGKKMLLMLVAGIFMGSALLLSSCQTSGEDGKEEEKKKAKKDRFRFLEKRETAPGHAADTSESTDSELVEFTESACLRLFVAVTAYVVKKLAGKSLCIKVML